MRIVEYNNGKFVIKMGWWIFGLYMNNFDLKWSPSIIFFLNDIENLHILCGFNSYSDAIERCEEYKRNISTQKPKAIKEYKIK